MAHPEQQVGTEASSVSKRASAGDAYKMHAATTWQRAMMRMPAMMLTFAIEMVVAFVISRYEDTLKAYPLLISFQPIISAVSGNVGLQSASIIVRNLALGLDSERKFMRALLPELKAGTVIASIMTLVVGGTALFWYAPGPLGSSEHTWPGAVVFGMTIGVCIFVSMLMAALSGTAAPLVFKRLGCDPSAMGGPMETAFQDIVGGTFLLALAGFLLQRFGDHGQGCPGGSAGGCIELCKIAAGNVTSAPYDPQCLQSCIDAVAASLC